MRDGAKKRFILLCAYHEAVVFVAGQICKQNGYRMIEARNAREFLLGLRGHREKIVLGIVEADMSGVRESGLLSTLQNNYQSVPLVIISESPPFAEGANDRSNVTVLGSFHPLKRFHDEILKLLPETKDEGLELRMGHIASCRILVIDDEPEFCEFVRDYIHNEKLEGEFEVKIALSGKEAFKTVNDFKPDIVVADVKMHEENGYEVMNRLKSYCVFQPKGYIFLTNSECPEILKQIREAGYKVLRKTECSKLMKAIRSICIRENLLIKIRKEAA